MGIETEILVVGGGPAGLATALELRRLGREVLVVDRSRPPIDKACGEGLMPDGLKVLEDLGVSIEGSRSAAIRGIRYLEGRTRVEAEFPGRPGLGIRRPVLHQALVDRAQATGVRTRWGVSVQGLEENEVRTTDGPIAARWIVGADGLHSRVRRWVGLDRSRIRFRRAGVRRHFRMAPWTDLVEVYWTDGCEAYVTPVSADEVGVALLWSGQKADFDTLLARFPVLAERLEGIETSSDSRGAAQLEQRTRGVQRGRVALVGDAAGYRDAITGEGLSLAFHQARVLAEAIDEGDLRRYERGNRQLTALPYFLIRLLLEAERRPRLRRRMIRSLASEPSLFKRLLAIHVREAPPRSLGTRGVLRLARGLLS